MTLNITGCNGQQTILANSLLKSINQQFELVGYDVIRIRPPRVINGVPYLQDIKNYKVIDDDTRKVLVHAFMDVQNLSAENQDIQNLLAPASSDITEGDVLIYNKLKHRVTKAFKPQNMGPIVLFYSIQIIRENKA